ncbi:MAG: hypothetical protein EXR65_05590 [Dehalococcoidia bacterium]|nr:hypothetical protein [Dehalococcoidia bacterium]
MDDPHAGAPPPERPDSPVLRAIGELLVALASEQDGPAAGAGRTRAARPESATSLVSGAARERPTPLTATRSSNCSRRPACARTS